ncbi:MAG: hemolysin III family protein [Ruminococcus sp.]|nr:hemolysin III family protein [Ruminococcus sp.]
MDFIDEEYTLGEEIFNAVTHGIGALLALAGCAVIIALTAVNKGAIEVVSVSLYGSSLVILYSISTLYHALSNQTAKKVFKILDYNTIFLLIAGTYTPIALCCLRGALGWVVFGLIWGCAAIGIVLSSVNLRKFMKYSTVFYTVMGWGIVFAIKLVYEAMPLDAFVMLVAGGITYTIGVVFFVLDFKYGHSIWHIFVLGGSILHYFSIFNAILD